MARWLNQQERPAAPVDIAANQMAPNNDTVPWIRVRAQSADNPITATPGLISPPVPSLPPLVGIPVLPPGPVPSEYPSFILGDGVLAGRFAAAGRAPRLEVSAEFLLWWVKSASTPPLLTTSPPGNSGTLPGSAVLIGGKDLDDQFRPGGRFGGVLWLDDCASYGFDGRYFFTGATSKREEVNSGMPPGNVLSLFRPFFAINNFPPAGFPGPFREQVTGPGVSAGSFTAENKSNFWGADINYRDNLCCSCDCCSSFRADVLAGFRYLNLNESLTMTEDYLLLSPDAVGNPIGTRVVITDRFATDNDFYGGQLGTVMTYRRDRWSLDLRTTVALGSTHQRLNIDGGQLRVPPFGQGAPQTYVGGLLALPGTNIGEHTRNVFSVVPEVGLNLGYQLTDHLKAYVGYNFLYWSNVIRPGDQIDPFVDVTRIPAFIPPNLQGQIPPAAARPAVLFKETDFWAQGVNFGMELRW
jgi:hypothetical protein